jgi:hypothetical protein
MDITGIKNIITEYARIIFNPASLWAKAKEAIKLPYAKTYIAVAFIFTVVFLIFTFPYDMLIRRYMKNLEKGTLKSIYAAEINVGLIDDLIFNNVYLVLNSGSEINIQNIDADISLLRLLLQKDIKGDLTLDGFRYASGASQITMGNLSGNIRIDFSSFTELPEGGDIVIIIKNVLLKLGEVTLPDSMGGIPLNLPPAHIDSIKIEAGIAGQKINIRSIRIFGKDCNGSINGSIAMSKRFIASNLDLKLAMNADSPLIANYKELLGKFINDRNQLMLNIRGTMMSPRIDFAQSDTEAPSRPEHPMDRILPVQ